ncbi:MAG: hybrid sensor histidine kinase/response regulator [Gloeocapsa sp. UFS-A4-WI-NPMV-4B04]|jgi:signal transduction histidine kinase|nr:hybrid sensor histidine kinase/response regulator [Gloeocapsa sp. UFS-A4-WI-NPMV-4B04]
MSFQQSKVLIVDDNPTNIKVLFDMLNHSSFKVSIAKSGEDALSKVQMVLPDLILLDVMMPGIDGFETCRRLKVNPKTQEIPIIFLSALDEVINKVKAFDVGGVDYITKPFHTEEVLARVKNQLAFQAAKASIHTALEKEKELGELKTRFVSMTSHEFRTPLTTILSSAELLEKYSNKLAEEKKIQHLHRIQTSVKHMTELLNNVLLIGKAEAGKLQYRPVAVNLSQFCSDLVEELQLSSGNNHTIAFHEEGEYKTACLDEKLLLYIFSNLLSNAIKYSPEGGTVNFDLNFQLEKVIFRVQDQGIGIPAAEQDQLFNSFHRASNVGTISGTGLGLAIVKKAVDLHQGEIAVKSEVGVGTTFIVTLPSNKIGIDN